MQHTIDRNRLDDVVLKETEVLLRGYRRADAARRNVVGRDDFIALRQEPAGEMTIDETSAGD